MIWLKQLTKNLVKVTVFRLYKVVVRVECDGDSGQPQPGNEGGQDDSSAKVLATGIEVASQEEGDVVVLLPGLHDVQLELH